MLTELFSRWMRPRLDAAQSGLASSIRPPALRPGDSFFQTLLRWMPGESDPWGTAHARRPARPSRELPAARAQFAAMLEDVHSEGIESLLAGIKRSRSLRDLWHLRASVYNAVARTHTQAVADQRMARLNRYFPARAARPAAHNDKAWH